MKMTSDQSINKVFDYDRAESFISEDYEENNSYRTVTDKVAI
jgi:hypothetical protein